MENKSVTQTAKVCLCIWNVGLFSLVWWFYYNNLTFDTYGKTGAAVSILIFCFIYFFLCDLYKSFRIASYGIAETSFSQLISFGIADLVMYVECCLVHNRMANILPGVSAVVLQLTGTILLIRGFKYYFIKHIPPKKTVLIYGTGISIAEMEQFKERILKKYDHLFDVEDMVCEQERVELLKEKIKNTYAVVLYEVSPENRSELMEYAIRQRKSFYTTPRIEDILLQGCSTKHLLDTPLMKYDYQYEKSGKYLVKRGMDLCLSIVILVLGSPFMLLSAFAIKIEDGGPVFYRQDRCTKDGEVFSILKFRSMIVDAEKNGFIPCTDRDPRITKVGAFLRKTRMDELPQLFNILTGQMSFVGPRPERVEHVAKYTEELPQFAYRMSVKGGLTGYAQIFGKYNTSAYDKLRLDLMYIENQSFMMDIKLILLTIKIVFTPESTEGFSAEKSEKIAESRRKEIQFLKLNPEVEIELEKMVK